MDQSPNLSLSYVMAQQAQKHVTVNESFRLLDALVQARVISRTQNDEPAAPVDGDAWLLPSEVSGSQWSSFSENSLIVFQDGAWVEILPQQGWVIFVLDEGGLVSYGDNGWSQITSDAESAETALKFGVNTVADDTNRFAVKSDAILFSHDDVTPGTGSLRHVFNKSLADATGSILFQTGFSGRVEMGLLGNDDFSLQVSNDGHNFQQAISVNHMSGETNVSYLTVGTGIGTAMIKFDSDALTNNPFWAIGQGSDNSFFIQRLSGGFGTAGRVIIYDENGSLGLWGAPSSKGKIATRADVNADGVENILYLEQTALSVASGVAQFHNNQDTATPILRCTTNTRNVLEVPASGSISVEAPVRLLRTTILDLPSASFAGDGAMVYVTDSVDGPVPAFSDGTNWRRMTDRAIIV